MTLRIIKIFAFALVILMVIFGYHTNAQISPGDLSQVHADLEGMSNCTRCHILGDKVSNEKCLACHIEIKERIEKQKGYHSSAAVHDKSCFNCHNDHHGRNFEIIRFDKEKFDHSQAGYDLLGAHSKKKCEDCHKSEFITDQRVKNKKYYPTYLGLSTSCLTCHADFHQNTLSRNCSDCHDFVAFKPAPKFDHNKTKFQLAGKHQSVECIKCHKIEIKNGKNFQAFAGIPHSNCTNCHKDMHNGLFGQDCRQCHSEESFHNIQGMVNFDHNKTNFRLEDKHRTVACKSCHKTALTDPVKHTRCIDCHTDYHNNQFAKQGVSPDCSSCHNTKGFTWFSYSTEQHNSGLFPLQGAHLATPCFTCHKKTEKWNFKDIGVHCSDCHKDIHDPYLDNKYYPDATCNNCHSVNRWNEINFDHAKTGFVLSGAHQKQTCRICHFIKDNEGTVNQRFSGLTSSCTNCHKDVHAGQFENNGVTECNKCHDSNNWKIGIFDHSKTKFKLDGKHKNVACNKCHKPVQLYDNVYVQYKLDNYTCETCHR